jgi:hypothetical protein
VTLRVRLLDARTGEALLVRTHTGQAATIERMRAAIAWRIAEDLVVAARVA